MFTSALNISGAAPDDYRWGARIGGDKAPQRKLEILEGLHWWIASIFRGLFPQNEMPCKHDWASDVAIAHSKKDCTSFIRLLGKRQAVSEAKRW